MMNHRKSTRNAKVKDDEEIRTSDDLGTACASPGTTLNQQQTTADEHGSKLDHNEPDLSDDDPLSNVLHRIDLLEDANKQKDKHIKLLYGKIDLLEKQNKQQSDQQTDLTIRSMNQNIVISGKNTELNEPKGRNETENCKQIVDYRFGVYDDNGKLLGQRILPFDDLQVEIP